MKLVAIVPALILSIFLGYQICVLQDTLDIKTIKLTSAQTALTATQTMLDRCVLIFGEWDSSEPIYSKRVEVTSYTSRPEETDGSPYVTACNTPVVVGGVAVSRDLFDLIGGCGEKVILKGYGTLTINDKMNGRYENSVGDLKAARLHGRQTAELMWQ